MRQREGNVHIYRHCHHMFFLYNCLYNLTILSYRGEGMGDVGTQNLFDIIGFVIESVSFGQAILIQYVYFLKSEYNCQ
jgi:hypothetical protein